MSDREIYSHSGSLASLVADLKNGQRGIDSDSGDWIYRDYSGVLHASRSYKSYSGSVWNYNAIPTGLTGNRGLVTDSSGNIAASAVTTTELGYLSGVSSAIQTQLNYKISNYPKNKISNSNVGYTYIHFATFTVNSNNLIPIEYRWHFQSSEIMYMNKHAIVYLSIRYTNPSNYDMSFRVASTGRDIFNTMYVTSDDGKTFKCWIKTDSTTGYNTCFRITEELKANLVGTITYVNIGTTDVNLTNIVATSVTSATLITANGNIGIGTTAPETKLHVEGTAKVTGNVTLSNLTASKAIITDASKNVVSSSVTTTELGYLSGVSSAIQTQLNGKLSGSGTTGRIPYFTSGSAIGNSTLYINGKNLGIYNESPSWSNSYGSVNLGINAIWGYTNIVDGYPLNISNNRYNDGTDKPLQNGGSLTFSLADRTFRWYIDQGLTAGVAFTPTERMMLDAVDGLFLHNLTASRVLIADQYRFVKSSSVTSTELGLLSGRTSLLGGSGTADYIPRFSNSGTLANSTIRYVDFGNSTRESLWIGGRSSVTFYKDAGAGGSLTWEHNIGRNSDGTTYARSSGTASCFSNTGDTFYWYYDTGLTGGVTFTPTLRMSLGLAGFKISYLTADRVVYNNSAGYFQSSSVTSTELGYLSGVSSPIQMQLNWKIGGSGTSGRIPYFTGSDTIGSSNLYSGNKSIRLMAAPSSWGANFAAVEIGLNAIWGSYTVQDGYGLSYSCNRYHDGTGNKPYVSGASCSYDQDGGTHTWYVDTGLIAGVDFTPTERMQLNTAGLKLSNINPSAALVSDANRVISSSSVTSTELGYLSGVTSAIQTQLNGKISGSGTTGQFPIFTANRSVGDSYFSYIAGSSTYLWATASIAELMSLTPEHLWINAKMVCNGLSTGDNSTISTTSSSYSIDISTLTQYNIKFTSTVDSSVMLWKANVGDIIYLTNVGATQLSIKYDGESGGPAKELYPGQTMMLMCFNTYGYNNWYSTWAIWRTDTNPSSHLND